MLLASCFLFEIDVLADFAMISNICGSYLIVIALNL